MTERIAANHDSRGFARMARSCQNGNGAAGGAGSVGGDQGRLTLAQCGIDGIGLRPRAVPVVEALGGLLDQHPQPVDRGETGLPGPVRQARGAVVAMVTAGTTLALLGLGLVGLAAVKRRRQN